MVDVLNEKIEMDKKVKANLRHIYKSSLGALHNLSRFKDKYTEDWNEVNATRSLMDMSEKLIETNSNFINSIYLIIANIASDQEIDSLSKIEKVVKELILIISKCIAPLNGDKEVKRMKVQLEEGEGYIDVIEIIYKFIKWHLVEMFAALYHLAVNDNIKCDIYFTNKMSEHLRTVIYKGNCVEIEHALRLLHQLCFDKKIGEDVRNDVELIKRLNELKIADDSNKAIIKSCEGILWIREKFELNDIEDNILLPETSKLEEKEEVEEEIISEKHVMISYNRDSRDLCLKIKSELEKLNFKVWIDVEAISGSSLESMSNAIENSFCVLMCMTEKYKQSSNCRAEAEYAFQLNKPIVPLIMQANYKPDGW
jgi:hypothetical protein